jgi:hypothetical protein
MPFTSWPLQFGFDLARTVLSITLDLRGKCIPSTLYHYTGLNGVLGIGNSCAIHATSVEDSKDQTEIEHGIDIIREEIQRKLRESGLTSFTRMLLESLPDALSARKHWTFVACFCPKRGSAFHCAEYGGYCLQFDTLSSSEPQLRAQGLYADVQYQHVVYKPSDQHKAIRRAVASITASAARNSSGERQGPWAESLVKSHARIVAQCLMDIIASLKSCKFAKDREWRIVCRPKSSLASSEPDLDDAAFNSRIEIRDDSKRRVELSVREQGEIIVPFPKRVVPFSAIYVTEDSHRRDEERSAILHMLEANGRSDIPLVPFS